MRCLTLDRRLVTETTALPGLFGTTQKRPFLHQFLPLSSWTASEDVCQTLFQSWKEEQRPQRGGWLGTLAVK